MREAVNRVLNRAQPAVTVADWDLRRRRVWWFDGKENKETLKETEFERKNERDSRVRGG